MERMASEQPLAFASRQEGAGKVHSPAFRPGKSARWGGYHAMQSNVRRDQAVARAAEAVWYRLPVAVSQTPVGTALRFWVFQPNFTEMLKIRYEKKRKKARVNKARVLIALEVFD
ncbi:hypothetical protein GGTG_12467 [Gaeumannomyces tritici R3-111a-1]|uniref:Uncharacterized protein n=1 Tax=Gaeumannomyces tritici (strain R3-111a-1) TaxID=644352 RepID=J3PG40_GAET3|nr:hypothetical protein GGTG_12467 [Gaeumannomyces tritici R3-111a-1]EJT70294.1 hypothetical protein GGTG_12467 [Gaeumannomyces tritici R3-111a-1]